MTNPLKAEQLEILQTIAATNAGVGADTVDSRQTKGLLKRGYLMSLPRADEPSLLMITQAGREAAGILPEAPVIEATNDEPALQASVDASPADAAPAKATKKATVRAMLERPEGASIKQLCDSTGWLPHSVRGMIAGALKKDGVTISSAKVEGVRIYRAEVPAA